MSEILTTNVISIAAAIVGASIFIGFAVNFILAICEKKLTRTKTIWDDLFIYSIRTPLKFFIWILGAIIAAKYVAAKIDYDISYDIHIAKNLGVIFCLSWIGWRATKKYEEHLSQTKISYKDSGPISAATISISIKAVIILIAVLMLMQTFGVSISGLVAFGGIGGVVVGFAAKDLLSNLFGATLLYFDRPFAVGEWIRSKDPEFEGTVEHIGWRLTKIQTFDRRPLFIPNSLFSTIIIENPSRMVSRRFNETINISYEDIDKIDPIISQIRDMMNAHEKVDQKAGALVFVNKMSPFAIEIYADAFTTTTQWVEFTSIKNDLFLKISKIIEKNEARIASVNPLIQLPKS